MKKKLISILLVSTMLGSVLCACGGSAADTKETPKDGTSKGQEEEEQITLQYWYQGTTEKDIQFAEKLVASFEEKYPNIKIEATGMSNTISDQETKLNAATLSDTYPDVVNLVLAEVGSRAPLGEFEPLAPYIEKWEERDNIFESAYEMGKYQGEQVALGVYPNPQVYTYRKDSFKEAGLDSENPPTTWAELKEAAEKLTKRDGDKVIFAGLDIPSIDSSLVFTEPYMRTAGSQVINEEKGEPAFTDEAAIEALDFIGELAAMNVSIPHDQQKGDERPFMNGNAAISNLSVSQIVAFKENNPDVELGYLPIMKKNADSEPGTVFCGYQLIAMSANSKHKDAAWLFMQHIMSDEIVWARTETYNAPVIKNTLKDKYMEYGDKAQNEAVMNYVENGKGKATVPWINEFNKDVSVAYEEVINGKKTAKQALNDALELLNKEIKK